MVHYAVEVILSHSGFLSLVAGGQPAGFMTSGGDAEEAVERLVENFQAELWSGRVSAEDLLASYEHACEARGHSAATVSIAEVEAIRVRLDDLTDKWAAVPVSGSLTVEF